jgi:hypothetical protein
LAYVDDKGVERIGELIIDMSDITGGDKRKVMVECSFGRSDVMFRAIEPLSGREYVADIKFEGKLFKYAGPTFTPTPVDTSKYHM